jgi:hypothetical protein
MYYAAQKQQQPPGLNGEKLVATNFRVGQVKPEKRSALRTSTTPIRKNCKMELCQDVDGNTNGPTKTTTTTTDMGAVRKLRQGRPNDDEDEDEDEEMHRHHYHHHRQLATPKVGTWKLLVIPIRFADHQSRTLPSKEDLDILMNSKTPDSTLAPTGSVWSVYNENSYGMFNLESTVVDWVDTTFTEAQTAAGKSG